MSKLQNHLRNTLLAGAFAIVPVGVTAYVVWLVVAAMSNATETLFHKRLPLVGLLMTVALVYFTGLAVSSLIGKWVLKWIDRALSRVPGLSTLYESWKHVSLTPEGTEGTFSKVVLVQADAGLQLAFTSGQGIPGDETTWCVFVPGLPNPISGRMYFIKRDRCLLLDCSAEEAFKVLLSTGNYVPPQVGQWTAPKVIEGASA